MSNQKIPKILTPTTIAKLELKNRVVMPPMCMYVASNDGKATDFHFSHYTTRAIGQVGLLITEATAVSPEGRISSKDLGLWHDEQIEPLSKTVKACQNYGSKVAIQLGHAGRKSEVAELDSLAPSAIDFNPAEYTCPLELSQEDIERIINDFIAAAKRAVQAGFDAIEIHAAHGYLLHEFLSPLSNLRTDEYGGSLENRTRILKKILEGVRKVIPAAMPLWMRISASDYLPGGLICEDLIQIIDLVKSSLDAIHVSSGGLITAPIKLYPGYQLNFAEKIKKSCQLPVIAVGLLSSPDLVQELIEDDRVDFVALGRELLRNPYWVLSFAKARKIENIIPHAYLRSFL